MKFLHDMNREEIFYYLVLPLPNINTDVFMDCFSVDSEQVFIERASHFLKRFGFDSKNLNGLSDFIYALQIWQEGVLERASKNMNIMSLTGVVAWCLLQERYIDRISNRLQEISYKRVVV